MQQLVTLWPFLLMLVIFYFLLIRPQQKKQKDRQSMLNALKKGDRIVTVGGINGTITDIQEDTCLVRVAHNVVLTFDRSAISTVKSSEKTDKADKAEKTENDQENSEA